MSHLSEQDLILHYYGETEDPAPLERHLDTCPACRAAYGALERVLNIVDAVPVPERGASYEADVWRRVRPHVGQAFSLPPGFSPDGRRSGCRLYQQTALRAGDHMMAGVLDELERVLLEIAHAPSRLEPAQLDDLRLRLRSDGILFRIRVLGSTVRNQDAHKL